MLQNYTRAITFFKYKIFYKTLYKAFILPSRFCSPLIIIILSSERLLKTTKRVEVLRCEGRNQTHCGGSAQVSVAVGTQSHLKPGLEFLMRLLTRAGMTDKANIKMTLYILVYFSQIEFP